MTDDNVEFVLTDPQIHEAETSSPSGSTIAGTFVFLPSGREHEFRRQVRSRAAQYSHRIGPRKPKASKKPKKGGAKIPVYRTQLQIVDKKRSANDMISSLRPGNGDADPFQLPTAPPSPIKSHIGSHTDNPFSTYPVPLQPWFPQILSEMWTFMLRGWSALPVQQAERDHALLWVQRLTMSNPSYFYMNLLSVAEDLVLKGCLDRRIPLWLISRVVETINDTLSNAQEALAVGNILAVGRIAVHEIVLGDLQTGQNIHRPAFARMIKMAGGLDSLVLPALVREHLSWADRLMVHKTGIRIAELEPELAKEPTFVHTPQNFQTDVQVLRGYLPKRQPGPDGL